MLLLRGWGLTRYWPSPTGTHMTAQDMATTVPGPRAGQLGSVMRVLGGRGRGLCGGTEAVAGGRWGVRGGGRSDDRGHLPGWSRQQGRAPAAWPVGLRENCPLSPNPCHPVGIRTRFLTCDSKPMTLTTAQGTGTHPKHWMCRGHWHCREAQESRLPPSDPFKTERDKPANQRSHLLQGESNPETTKTGVRDSPDTVPRCLHPKITATQGSATILGPP